LSARTYPKKPNCFCELVATSAILLSNLLVMRIDIRVRPGVGRTKVGGSAGDPPRLIVQVAEPAVDGKATDAALKAVAKAFGLKAAQVELVSGHTSRDKVLQLSGQESLLNTRLAELLGL
jgi:uncharacterized protein (TIGR00251 family)